MGKRFMSEIKTPPEIFELGNVQWTAFNDHHTISDILRYLVQVVGGDYSEIHSILDSLEKESE
jgi:HEPN domain-containing protein